MKLKIAAAFLKSRLLLSTYMLGLIRRLCRLGRREKADSSDRSQILQRLGNRIDSLEQISGIQKVMLCSSRKMFTLLQEYTLLPRPAGLQRIYEALFFILSQRRLSFRAASIMTYLQVILDYPTIDSTTNIPDWVKDMGQDDCILVRDALRTFRQLPNRYWYWRHPVNLDDLENAWESHVSCRTA